MSRDQIARSLHHAGGAIHDVIVVDDEPDFVVLLTRIIHSISRRVQVRACYGGAEALAALREQKPDLILLDLVMPEVDGYTVLETIRGESALGAIPVIVLSAQGRQTETLTTGMLGVSRGDGLGVNELLRLLRVSIDALNPSVPSTDPECREAHPE
ncbi:MAG: response regulator [Chloroflexota bacterium]